MNKFELVEDLATLTNIPKNTLDRLTDVSILTIAQSMSDTVAERESVIEVDIGIGTLFISIQENKSKFKFLPSAKLEKQIALAATGQFNPVAQSLESNISKKIESTYKELI